MSPSHYEYQIIITRRYDLFAFFGRSRRKTIEHNNKYMKYFGRMCSNVVCRDIILAHHKILVPDNTVACLVYSTRWRCFRCFSVSYNVTNTAAHDEMAQEKSWQRLTAADAKSSNQGKPGRRMWWGSCTVTASCR